MASVLNNLSDIEIVVDETLLDSITASNESSKSNKDDEYYSMYLNQSGEFIPAVNLKTAEKLPSGVYRTVWKQDDYHIIPVKINTDELYRFSEDFTDVILNEVNKFWKCADVYAKYKFTHKRGLLLAGAPGCGKSAIINLLIKQLIEQDGLIFFINNVKDFSVYTEILKPVIRKIEPDRPIITIIEDIDQLIENLNGSDAELLDLLDGKGSIEHHLIIMTSNDTSNLSEALLRPSRIDMQLEVPAPNAQIRKEYYIKKGVDESQLNEFVEKTEGMTFAELKEIFVGVMVLGKTLDEVIQQILHPLETKDYLIKPKTQLGI